MKHLVANNFHDAAVSFLLEPFMTEEEINALGEKELPQDPSIIHSVVHNSSMWVIGSFIPDDDEEGYAMKN